MTFMKILIVDDEDKARSLLKNIILKLNNPSFVFYEADDLQSAVESIKTHRPDLVFLDIEMPREQGTRIFEYLEKSEITFRLVFTTAYGDFALEAFEMDAEDYIMKPIRPNRIYEVIEKTEDLKKQKKLHAKLHELKQVIQSGGFEKIGVPVQDGIMFIKLNDIIHLAADGMYTKIYRASGDPLLISKPLKFFSHLPESGKTFYRPHRSHIFNLKYLKQYVRRDGNYILLDNNTAVPLSKEKKEEFLNLISDL